MFNIIFSIIITFLVFTLSSCVTQESAPIEYKQNSASKDEALSNNNYQQYNVNQSDFSEEIVSRPLEINKNEYDKPIGEMREPHPHRDEEISERETIMPLPKSSSATKFSLPVQGEIITKFGAETLNGKSNGIEIIAPEGTEIVSIGAGVVVYAGFDDKFGNLVITKLEEKNLYVAYAHMSGLLLNKNDKVTNSTIIGHVGSTGATNVAKLYLAIREGKISVDPMKYCHSIDELR